MWQPARSGQGPRNAFVSLPTRIAQALLPLALMGAASAARADSYTLEEGFARPGADYEVFEQNHSYPDHDNCQAACLSQPRCKSYTYVRPSANGTSALCLLKSGVPPPVQDACCISGVKGGKPKQLAVPSLQLEWLAWHADKVGKAPQAQKADGAPDHHLRLRLNLAAPQEIIAIELLEADVRNQAVKDGLHWSTQDANAEYLAAESDGRRLNPTAVSTLGRHAGDAVFDLYAHDIGQWDVGRSIVAQVLVADGRKLAHAFTLKSPPNQLLGIWQMHCENFSSPEAFEPRFLSGRLNLVWQPDGKITGYFGTLPLIGALDASGKIQGRAEDAAARVVWQGQVAKPRRGKPLRGSGSFKFEREQDGCLGEGAWTNRIRNP